MLVSKVIERLRSLSLSLGVYRGLEEPPQHPHLEADYITSLSLLNTRTISCLYFFPILYPIKLKEIADKSPSTT